ncbi:MAG: flagellar hook basal-body protein [Myxococcales bacterium]|nr:flagellar hook basal-body protein [Myxococcales bacterium]
MSHGIYSALSGALAQQSSLDTIAQNLANSETTGYRSVRPVFHEIWRGQTAGGDRGRYALVGRTAIDTSAGARRRTDRALDVALPDDAFLTVRTARGDRYTRAGSLQVSPEGRLVTEAGDPLVDENDEVIEVGLGVDVSIAPDGAVLTEGSPAGQLRIVGFDDPTQLVYEGATLLAAGPGTGAATPVGATLAIGELEGSNATPVRAMTDLIQATRMFEAMEQAIRSFQDIDKQLVTTVPR